MIFLALLLALSLPAFSQSGAPAPQPANTAPAAAVQPEAQLLPCLIVKRRSLSDRIVGLGIVPGNRYDMVDAQAVSGPKMSYKAKELELLQSANVKVVVLQKTYSVEELKGARLSCNH